MPEPGKFEHGMRGRAAARGMREGLKRASWRSTPESGRVARAANGHPGNPTASELPTKPEGADGPFELALDPRVDSANGAAGLGLREIVMHREIRGALRSVKSMIASATSLRAPSRGRTVGRAARPSCGGTLNGPGRGGRLPADFAGRAARGRPIAPYHS